MSMTFKYFHDINTQRSAHWHELKSWSLSDWYTAFMGEAGEAGNVIKKMNRFRDKITGNRKGETPEELYNKLQEELADAFIYLDLLATAADVDLEFAVKQKFNRISEELDFSERL